MIRLKFQPTTKLLIHAGGALALFVIVYFFAPADLKNQPDNGGIKQSNGLGNQAVTINNTGNGDVQVTATVNNDGLKKEEYRQMLREELARTNKESQAPGLAAEERRQLEQKAKVLEEKLINLQKSYEEEIVRRKNAEKSLDDFKGQLSVARIAEAKKSLTQGDAKAAEQVFDEVVDKDGKQVALAAYQSGQLAEGRVDYAKAMRQYKKAVALEENNPDYLLTAGAIARTLGNYAQAQEWLERLLKMREAEGKDGLDLALAQHELAWLYDDQGQYEKAEPLYKRSLDIREKTLGKDHPDVAASLNNLAVLYTAQVKYKEAEPLLQRALDIKEKTFGKDHPDTEGNLNNLAILYQKQGRYAEAEPLYKRDLKISEKSLGKDHPEVATTLNNLANLYQAQGRYEAAEPLYQRSLAIKEKSLGKDHPEVAATLNNLAWLYYTQGKYVEAGPLYQRAIAILKAKLPAGHPDITMVQTNYDDLKRKLAGQ
ncbi:tetratricopeptide repeat protein [Candidatus Electronema sp. PJ]|uniref:tetratricopeptide repeat protein n=1 Tax=Candidatus Electronema sp. PJ TaxID=3401572 RepID=UPI003AA9936C